MAHLWIFFEIFYIRFRFHQLNMLLYSPGESAFKILY